jgi:DNA-binding transcriptional ArsR family regulator
MLICVPVDLTDAATLLKLLGEPVRWSIVQRLAVEDLCVCHLVDDLGLAQPLVSHHLRALRHAGLVRTEPCGAFTYYILDRSILGGLAERVGALAAEPGTARRRPCG